MILNVILAVLVALVLINIVLAFYIKKELEIFEKHFKLTYGDLIKNVNKLHLDLYKVNGEIFKELETQSKQIKEIPKEITIKNVLKLP